MTTEKATVHTAYKDYPEFRAHAASVDGETWAEVDRKATDEDYDLVAEMTGPEARHVLFARRYLTMNGWTIE